MKGDFSRDTFDISKHFSRVLQQQGRVQLDADWNEQTAILLHYLRTLAADIIGPYAGPAGDDYGFAISVDMEKNKLIIGKGRYYVDGILCENEKELDYLEQVDYPHPPLFISGTSYLVYLDVWERHVTALEDDYIREKALGGPDTASRAKVVWQVKVEAEKKDLSFPSSEPDPEIWPQWIKLWQAERRGCLRVQVKQPEKANDPCLTPPDAKYRGPENQLYRVEIHEGGTINEATFKWSRDNGAVVTKCREKKGMDLTVDNSRGFAAGHWVELTNEDLELRGQPGTLVEVMKVEGDVLTLRSEPSHPKGLVTGESWPAKVRRWESGAVKIEENSDKKWIDLEYGIQIQFLKAEGDNNHHYRSGDYWLIPARTATGNIEWPQTDQSGKFVPLPQPPHGVHHHYAPLAILNNINGTLSLTDLRCQFRPVNNCGFSSFGGMGIGRHSLCPLPSSVQVER